MFAASTNSNGHNKAISLSPDNPSFYFHLGISYLVLGTTRRRWSRKENCSSLIHREQSPGDAHRQATEVMLWSGTIPQYGLEVSSAVRMAAIAIEFKSFACAFARRAAIFATFLRWTGAHRVLALFLFFVCHNSSCC